MYLQKNTQHIIIVDDDTLSNRISTLLIKNIDNTCQVTDFTDGLTALEYIRYSADAPAGCPPTIVLLDINMPVLDGWDFLDKFDLLNDTVKRKFKIFFYSSSVDVKDKLRAEANPYVSWYFVKPLTKNMIYGMLTETASLEMIPFRSQHSDFSTVK